VLGSASSSHNRLNPLAAASPAHLASDGRPLSRGLRVDGAEVEREETATSSSHSDLVSAEFQTVRGFLRFGWAGRRGVEEELAAGREIVYRPEALPGRLPLDEEAMGLTRIFSAV
jgi:hypothetical protein